MVYWKSQYPENILDINYFDLVTDTDAQLLKIEEFLQIDRRGGGSKPINYLKNCIQCAIVYWRRYSTPQWSGDLYEIFSRARGVLRIVAIVTLGVFVFFNSMGFLRLVSRAGSRSIDPEMAVSQMAQAAYVQALKAEIVKAGLPPLQSETAHE